MAWPLEGFLVLGFRGFVFAAPRLQQIAGGEARVNIPTPYDPLIDGATIHTQGVRRDQATGLLRLAKEDRITLER